MMHAMGPGLPWVLLSALLACLISPGHCTSLETPTWALTETGRDIPLPPPPNCNDEDYGDYYNDDNSSPQSKDTPQIEQYENTPMPVPSNRCSSSDTPREILVMELADPGASTLVNALTGGVEVKTVNLVSIMGDWENTGCFKFVSIEKSNSAEELTKASNSLNMFRKVLFIVDNVDLDQNQMFPNWIKNQLKLLKFSLGDLFMNNIIFIIHHLYDEDQNTEIQSSSREALHSTICPHCNADAMHVFAMKMKKNFYVEMLKDARIDDLLKMGETLQIISDPTKSMIIVEEGIKFDDKPFTISAFYHFPRTQTWELKWVYGDDTVLWRVKGSSDTISSYEQVWTQEGIETSQSEVSAAGGNIIMITIQVTTRGQLHGEFNISCDANGESASALVTMRTWGQWAAWSDCNQHLKRTRTRQCLNSDEKGCSEEQEVLCDITSLSDPNHCKRFKYPHPRFLLLGATGVGKSTLGNVLLGVNKGKRKNFKLGKQMESGESLPFQPGSGMSSKTVHTQTFNGQFLGTGICTTFIDTPGAGDSQGRDYKHAISMAKFLKEDMGSFDVILLMFKGTDRRFSAHTISLLKLYLEIFGENMWNHVIVEMSYWSHTKYDYCKRQNDLNGLDEFRQMKQLNEKLKEQFDVKIDIPVVFVDPVVSTFFPKNHPKRKGLEQREIDIFKHETDRLWNLASNMPAFECSSNCQAPDEFYMGIPWIQMSQKDSSVQDGRESFKIQCKIWDGVVTGSGKNSDDVTWFWSREGDTGDGEKIFEQQAGVPSYLPEGRWRDIGIEVTPAQQALGSYFSISQVIIPKVVGAKHQGTYKCQNKKGSSVWKLVVPYWSNWSEWSSCTLTCKDYQTQVPGSGSRVRRRRCVGHKDEDNTCQPSPGGFKDEQVETDCTGNQGNVVFCPIPPEVTDWSAWSSCSLKCGRGKRSKDRTCKKGSFGLTHEDDLCPTTNNAIHEEVVEACEVNPCPIDCKYEEWGSWSRCTKTCYMPNTEYGIKERIRKSKPGSHGGKKCAGLNKETDTCGQTPICPIDGKWSSWSKKGSCSQNCGPGQQNNARTCTGIQGYGKSCWAQKGYRTTYEERMDQCEVKPCPVACVLSDWSDSSACTASCGSTSTGKRTRRVVTSAKHGGTCSGDREKKFTCYGGSCPAPKVVSGGGCYSLESLVTLDTGRVISMSSLRLGDNVEVTDTQGRPGHSQFLGWMEKEHQQTSRLLEIETENGDVLKLSDSHAVFYLKNHTVQTIFAKDLVVGDTLVASITSSSAKEQKIRTIQEVIEAGYLDPLTQSGTIMVNNISTSCYASYSHWLADLSMLPAKMWPTLLLDDQESQHQEGTRNYINAIKLFGRMFSVGRKTDHHDTVRGEGQPINLVMLMFFIRFKYF